MNSKCPHCDKVYHIENTNVDRKVKCSSCGDVFIVKAVQKDADMKTAGLKEYKVLSRKDKFFSGKFDPAMLENAMNEYAKYGWRVIAVTTAAIEGFSTSTEEIIIVLERDKRI